MDRSGDVDAALSRARAHAPFLRGAMQRSPDIVEIFRSEGADAAVAAALARSEDDVGVELRRRRDALALAVALGDLSGEFDLETATRHLSDFADRAIDRALAAAIDKRVPGAPLEGITAIALGKLGSRELNYSSDVDLILLYDPERLPRRERDDPAEAAMRISREMVRLLQERTVDGYVARVDLRLRPASEVTPIALPVSAAISHYESAALGWERAAFIRARCAAGDALLGSQFLEAVQPFVWRRALDFGVIEEIGSIAARVRDHYASGQTFGPGFDLKRGRGGIREVEFSVQALQMIHGGRDPTLRTAATLDSIVALNQKGHLDRDGAAMLAEAYRRLRTAEHRIQMVDDKQTHEIPRDEAALENVAALAGWNEASSWLDWLRGHVDAVAGGFNKLMPSEAVQVLPTDREKLDRALARAGLEEREGALRLIAQWRTGRARSLRSPAARSAFEAMLPTMIEAIAAAPDPAHALNRFADIVEGIPSGVNFYRLLEARPELARLLARILSTAPALAQQLARRPALLDGLLDRSMFDPLPDAETFAAMLGEQLDPLEYDVALDRVRAMVGEKRFALGVQLIDGKHDPLDIAKGYARVAEGAILALGERTRREFEIAHGKFDGDGLIILGLGRLGGEALTHASDLDIIFLYDMPTGEQSDGPRPLGPTDYYNRLASRISAALSVPTARGPLYEVDTRLRPQGTKGSLAVSMDAFAAYQRSEAWTWEHLALCRARPIFGSEAAQETACAILADIYGMDRDVTKLREDAAAMRAEMMQAKPPKGPFDIKLGAGGLVDLEFAVHVTQLATHEGLDPDLARATEQLAEAGLAPASLPADNRLLTAMLVVMRLIAPDTNKPARASRDLLAEVTGYPDWEALLEACQQARQRISDYWEKVRHA
ncbi:bifunctional [glutamine synthetase] adenylyltransferase/[glutamine synthetase]-adenylyl-L-tyrosine phosphorylase [Sphingomicrobium marinum]|uniref:bifunctional [glutamine synthetase] adenylyltransferase/[glutamine synthetase]-adenylyl-L-tyrosine phosphorylase n=1 Tax=Sphingomicrobium marinum TaxID=1227950 RepID=UPI00223F28FC|nr:bifunctional [glutamine synthetase] adenylyltransferase/[glutamine synthetase]-adenylyl-L-tyrosine phosphorylase [Sphingomicrobium marinum]